MDVLAKRSSAVSGAPVRVDRLDCRALTARVRIGDTPVLLAKPQTFMNVSGESVKGLIVKHGVALDRLLVVLDEAALPLGRLRLRASGSSAGQKGLQSVIDCLGTNEVPRLRVGIAGEHQKPGELGEYVLSRFSKAERPVAERMVAAAADAAETFVRDGLDAAQAAFNRVDKDEPRP